MKYQTKEQAIVDVVKWTNEHAHEFPKGLRMTNYLFFPECPEGCRAIVLECKRTHKIVRRFYYKEGNE